MDPSGCWPTGRGSAVAGFGAGHREQIAKLFVGGILLHGAEGRQGEHAERRLVPGDLAQRFGRLAAIEVGQGLGGIETRLRILRRHALQQRIGAFRADRFQLERGLGRRGRIEQLLLQRGDALHPLGRRFTDRHRANDLNVAGDVVFVTRVYGQLDELVGFGLGHARLDAALGSVESLVDGIRYPRTVHHVLMAGGEHEPQRTRFQSHAAAENLSTTGENAVLLGVGRGIDHDRTLGQRQQVAAMDLVAQHGRLGQPRFQQVAAAQTGGFALRRNADFNVEMIALLNARPQNPLHQHQRDVAGSQHGVRIGYSAGLHLVQQCATLRRRAGIAARAVQAGH